jgi:hypothetical protein
MEKNLDHRGVVEGHGFMQGGLPSHRVLIVKTWTTV